MGVGMLQLPGSMEKLGHALRWSGMRTLANANASKLATECSACPCYFCLATVATFDGLGSPSYGQGSPKPGSCLIATSLSVDIFVTPISFVMRTEVNHV